MFDKKSQFLGCSVSFVSQYILLFLASMEIIELKIYIQKGRRKSQSGSRNQEKIPTPKTEVGKTKLTIGYLYHENIVTRMISYFPKGWPISYINFTKI